MSSNKSKQIEELILGLSPDDFDNLEEYRKVVVSLTRKLGTKLKEGAEEVLDEDSLRKYILVLSEVVKELSSIPSTPNALKIKERSKSAKEIIKENLYLFELTKEEEREPLMKQVLNYITKSSTVVELKISLRLLIDARKVFNRLESSEHNAEVFEGQNLFQEETALQLEYYKEKSRQLEDVLCEDDEDFVLALSLHKRNKEGLGRLALSKEFCITEKKVRYLLDKYKFE